MKNIIISLFIAASFAVAASVNYTYDATGRLTVIDYGAGGSITYTYDAAGNITSRVVQAGSMSPSIVISAKPSPDGAAIRIAGTNLVPAGAALSVTIDGQTAKILSTCSASTSRECRSDRILVSAPSGFSAGKGEISIYHDSAKVASFRRK